MKPSAPFLLAMSLTAAVECATLICMSGCGAFTSGALLSQAFVLPRPLLGHRLAKGLLLLKKSLLRHCWLDMTTSAAHLYSSTCFNELLCAKLCNSSTRPSSVC